jgi:hypothetical protein
MNVTIEPARPLARTGRGEAGRSRHAHCAGLFLIALALTGCATTRYITVSCVTRQQYSELQRAEPPKVGDKLTGQADSDIRIVAGSAIRLRAWGDGLLGVLEGCQEPPRAADGGGS